MIGGTPTRIGVGTGGRFFKRGSTPVVGVFGAHYEFVESWRLGAGVGPGFTQGLGSPEVRTLVSLEWFPDPKKDEPKPMPPRDADRDGIFDRDDACPQEPGERNEDPQRHGCPPPPDADGDGVIDSEDACVDEPGVVSEDPAKNGCPPPKDRDSDGILDAEDACPDEAGVADAEDPEKHGCPIRDTDGDGIFDPEDACVETPGVASGDPTKHGCPKAKIEGGQVKILDRIEFDTGKATIRPESNAVLEAVLKILREHPEITLVAIEGHTDNKGSTWLNRKLSGERASSVKKWLVDQGIDAARLTSAGFGPDKPIDDNNTEEGRQNNRRVEFHIRKTTSKASGQKGNEQ